MDRFSQLFEDVVTTALDEVPSELLAHVENVEFLIEDSNEDDPDLYGLYSGVPLTERDTGYGGVLPDRITVYRGPLVAEFGDNPTLLAEEIRITVLHELGHYFGLNEDRLDALGWA